MKKFAAMLLLGMTTFAFAQKSSPPTRPTLGGLAVPGFEAKTLPSEQFTKIHAAVAPSGENERWMEIPWASDLQEARQKAVQEKKPLLMWIMDGHPLGCT